MGPVLSGCTDHSSSEESTLGWNHSILLKPLTMGLVCPWNKEVTEGLQAYRERLVWDTHLE